MHQAKTNGMIVATYAYNGRGERVRKVAATVDTRTLYDESGRWIGDYTSSGVPLQQAIWLDDMPVGLMVGVSSDDGN